MGELYFHRDMDKNIVYNKEVMVSKDTRDEYF